jgi:hypothetical protein
MQKKIKHFFEIYLTGIGVNKKVLASGFEKLSLRDWIGFWTLTFSKFVKILDIVVDLLQISMLSTIKAYVH